jgi:hypothetical protein
VLAWATGSPPNTPQLRQELAFALEVVETVLMWVQAMLMQLDDAAKPIHRVHQLRRAFREEGKLL